MSDKKNKRELTKNSKSGGKNAKEMRASLPEGEKPPASESNKSED
ncbi:MAG: hypothetical protein ABEK59_12480 [Halobacteria archaeon]